MSWQASSWVLKQKTGNPILKVLLLAVANYADPSGRCWPSNDVLADDSEVSKRTIQRKLQELVELGFISVTEQFDKSGRQTTSLIQMLMGEGDRQAAGGRVTPACHPGGDNMLSPPESLNNQKNKQSMSGSKKKDEAYSEDFEALWQAYPRTKNTSKKAAWDIYRMLNTENQERVRIAVPQFAAAMRAEGRTEDKIKHMQFWLSARMYETASAPASAASTAPAKPFWETATRKQWGNVLLAWSANWQWSKSWGPEPDQPGCHVPQDILDRFDLKYRGHLFSPEHMAAIRERVSKQSVDAQQDAVA